MTIMKKMTLPVVVACQDCKKLFILGRDGVILKGFYLCDACAKVTRKGSFVKQVGTENG